ncbi:M48 family metallopeptidase [Crassaminicella profunda]|uniref:M48 family metallopeptidase n=1 Tax=Crassaminicella profunda TaxID=1286698 RepID=UPI001FE32C77|nr:SprT family zinc-dependent metalloprotease [Crassaminicella profunda]
MKFYDENLGIEFSTEYRNRKTFEIRIEPPNRVTVRAPKGSKEEDVLKIVGAKEKWIRDKLSFFKGIDYTKMKKEYVNGEIFLYLGEEYPLKVIMDYSIKKPVVKLEKETFYITTNTEDENMLKKAMKEWYRKKTLEEIMKRTAYFQKNFLLKPNKIKVKDQKKRWGSCSSKMNLNFNLRCIMMPRAIIDYLVVHEMCHMVHMNHSKAFWQLVGKIIPDYKERRMWLKENGMRMHI